MKRFGVILLLVLRAIAFADPTEEDFLTNAASFLKSSPKQSFELEKADIWVFLHLRPKEITEFGCQKTMALIDSAIVQKNARGYFARAVMADHCRGEFPTPESDMNEAAKHNAVYSEVRKGIAQSVEVGKQKQTMADIRAFAMAVEFYAVDFNKYPEETTGKAASLVNKLQGAYIKQLPLIDPWGNAYRYYCLNSQGDYWIISFGKDGIAESGIYNPNGIPNNSAKGTIQNFDGDLIYSAGTFVRSPYPAQEMTPKSTAPSTHEFKAQTPSELSSLARADEYFRYSEYAGAVQLYKQALNENPKLKSKLTEQIVKCYYNLGLMKLRKKDCNLATDYFRQVLFINEKDLLSKEALEISRTCQSKGFDSVSLSVFFLELRK